MELMRDVYPPPQFLFFWRGVDISFLFYAYTTLCVFFYVHDLCYNKVDINCFHIRRRIWLKDVVKKEEK